MNPLDGWKNWHYKNTTLLILSLALFFYFADTSVIQNLIEIIGNLGYFGAFLTGVFFVYTFTVAPAAVILYKFADAYNPFAIALLAGTGSVIGDYMIFKYLRDKVFGELYPIFAKIGGNKFAKIFRTPFFAWIIPLAGLLIIASPFPDEAGVAMLGASKLKNWQFLLLTFLLNAVGIFVIVTLARSI